jgi:two-component system chemotaxis sensor kinase CheA
MDDLLQEFLTETNEGLATLDQELVRLEQTPNDPKLLDNIFRIVHTIKGTCGFLGLPRLESVAHAAENLLGKFRDGTMTVSPEGVTIILAALDRIKSLLATLEATEAEPAGDDSELIARINAMAEGQGGAAEPAAAPAAAVEDAPVAEAVAEAHADEPHEAAEALEAEVHAEVHAVEAHAAEAEAAPARSKAVAKVAADADAAPAKDSGVAAQSIRVHVDLLEDLMTMVSELVLTRNQLLQILRTQKESEFATPLQRLNLVTSELQEGVMKTRMQPIGNAWAKLPRVVRDLAHEVGKKIDLQMHGAETELDRQLLELIKDPLTHMVRNSADHGLETPAERRAAGKPEVGRIMLDARHEGGHIVIEISDDGRGLAIDKIKAKALKNGLATEAELAQMTDQQIQQFIFKAGFSTAAQVTSISGRGVGMDVVRTNIDKIGGTIELWSVEGKGTTFTIKIPLTLAIVNALIVECGGERFAVPQISVVELVRASANSDHRIEHVKGVPVLRLRNRLLPLVSLDRLLKLTNEARDPSESSFIIVTQVGTYVFGIIVDRVYDMEEIVVKPVAPLLRDLSLFSGNTILGDGSVVMILDPNGIAAATGEIAPTDEQSIEAEAGAHEQTGGERMALLLFQAGGRGTPLAVPLSLVARLEEIEVAKIERSDGKPVVQYRGKLMPLVFIDGTEQFKDKGQQPVIVFGEGDQTMGLVVDEIVDIVEDHLQVELGTPREGLLGSAVIASKSTDVIDAGYYLKTAFADASGFGERLGHSGRRRILLVDDSPFFRNLLTPLLSVAGYHVTSVASGDQALSLCDAGQSFDVIVSDIDMPGMTGFEFAEAVRRKERWSAVPLVAISDKATVQDLDRGRTAGFSDYVGKFDRAALLQTLSETLELQRSAA